MSNGILQLLVFLLCAFLLLMIEIRKFIKLLNGFLAAFFIGFLLLFLHLFSGQFNIRNLTTLFYEDVFVVTFQVWCSLLLFLSTSVSFAIIYNNFLNWYMSWLDL